MTSNFISVCLEVIHKEGTLWEESVVTVLKEQGETFAVKSH